jgi:hypothetical protein
VKQHPAALENKGLAGCSAFFNCQRWDFTMDECKNPFPIVILRNFFGEKSGFL